MGISNELRAKLYTPTGDTPHVHDFTWEEAQYILENHNLPIQRHLRKRVVTSIETKYNSLSEGEMLKGTTLQFSLWGGKVTLSDGYHRLSALSTPGKTVRHRFDVYEEDPLVLYREYDRGAPRTTRDWVTTLIPSQDVPEGTTSEFRMAVGSGLKMIGKQQGYDMYAPEKLLDMWMRYKSGIFAAHRALSNEDITGVRKKLLGSKATGVLVYSLRIDPSLEGFYSRLLDNRIQNNEVESNLNVLAKSIRQNFPNVTHYALGMVLIRRSKSKSKTFSTIKIPSGYHKISWEGLDFTISRRGKR